MHDKWHNNLNIYFCWFIYHKKSHYLYATSCYLKTENSDRSILKRANLKSLTILKRNKSEKGHFWKGKSEQCQLHKGLLGKGPFWTGKIWKRTKMISYIWKRSSLKRKLAKSQFRKGHVWKNTILRVTYTTHLKSQICKMTTLESTTLEKDNSEQEIFEKRTVWRRKIIKGQIRKLKIWTLWLWKEKTWQKRHAEQEASEKWILGSNYMQQGNSGKEESKKG